jgi:integrase
MAKPWKHKDGTYRFNYTDANGKRTTGYGCSDLDATKRIMAKTEHEAYLARKGLVDPREQGYIDAEKKPLSEHVSDWVKVLEARKAGDKHVKQMEKCMEAIIAAANINRINQLSADVIQRAIASLASEVQGSVTINRGLATLNRYIVAVKAFTAWMASDSVRRMRSDTLKSLQKYRANTDRKIIRRALTTEEVSRLIKATVSGVTIRGMSGTDRAMLYRVALGTGFRASELASLTPESFNLDPKQPTITVQAAHSKHRREDVQPIARQLATVLKPWIADKAAGERVFAMPDSSNTAKMLKVDMDAAGIERSTSDGVADFHALRHTFITRLSMSGERIKVVQELARHSKAELTLGVYTHAGLHDLQGAVDRLPATDSPQKSSEAMKATGTFGKVGEDRSSECMQKGGFSGRVGASSCKDRELSDDPESPRNSDAERASTCQEMKWSDGESNPDLLNAIQPSSR